MYQLVFFCSMQRDWRDVFWQWAGCAWTTSPFLFCSSWHQQRSSRAMLYVMFLTSFAALRTWIGKYWFFFPVGEHTTSPKLCFPFAFQITLLFLARGSAFCACYQFPDQSWECKWQEEGCLRNIAEECEAVSDPCPVLHLHSGECTHLDLAFPTSGKGMKDKGLFLDVSGCCQGKTLCWCCITVITVTMNQDI